MNHALMGVERGLKEDHHMPVEVGGFLMGHVDSTDERTLVVMDVSRRRRRAAHREKPLMRARGPQAAI